VSDRRAEVVKLARVLDLEPDVLSPLALDADGLRSVREALSASLFDASRPTLQRVAKASKLLPNGTAAKVGEHVFGPLLCARIVGLLAPEHAIDLALRMPDVFLADTSAQLDPRRARELVASLPTERIVAVARVLVERQDFLTLARFVDYLSNDTIAAVIASIHDELALLRIAVFIESSAKLAELLDLISDERLQRMLAAVRAANAWDTILPLLAAMGEHALDRFLAVESVADHAVLRGLVGAAERLDMWHDVLPVAARMPPLLRQRFADVIAYESSDVIDHIVFAAHDTPSWFGALAVACELPPSGQQRVMQRLSVHFEDCYESLAAAARDDNVWRALVLLVPYLPLAQRDRLACALA
jgi:hypothetical protein